MTNFVIISSSRSGTTWLQTSLDSHPSIRCYGELMNPKDKDGFKIWLDSSLLRHLYKYLPGYVYTRYFDTRFISQRPDFPVLGYKLLYPGQLINFPDIRPYWWRNTFKVIRLVRTNYLRRYLSGQIAINEGRWQSVEREGRLKKVKLDCGELVSIFERTDIINKNIESIAANYTNIYLSYEDLSNDFNLHMKRIFSFLDVDEDAEIEVKTKKRNPNDLREMIENYDEVVACLEKSRFKHFLD